MSLLKANAVQLGQSVTATNNFTWYQPASPDGTVRLGNGNSGSVTDLVTLTSAGNLGIGTSSPGAPLTFAGATGRKASFYQGTQGYSIGVESSEFRFVTDASAIFSWRNGSTYSTSTEYMRLDSSGNLGLGVTPKTSGVSGYIELMADKYITSQGDGNTFASNSYYSSGWKYSASALATRYTQYVGQHQWHTAPSGTAGNAISWTQAMTLDASGNLFLGATSSVSNSRAWLAGDFVAINGIGLNSTNASGTDTQIYFLKNSSGKGTITTTTSGTQYNTTSDQRLKTNVTPAGSAIQSILDFPVDQFDWIVDGSHQDFGAVAQKAINVIPEMVSVPADPDEMWGIDWSKAVPRLIKTIQELSAELNELKAKVNA